MPTSILENTKKAVTHYATAFNFDYKARISNPR